MSDEPKYRDSEWLRVAYKERSMTVTEIADLCGCDSSTISRWLGEHNIDTRSGGSDIVYERLADSEWLYEQYIEKKKTVASIAGQCGSAEETVSKWLDRHGIETRGFKLADTRLTDREWLYEQYVNKQRHQSDIAKECGCHPSTVSNWLKNHNIATRKGYAGKLGYPRLKDEEWLREQYVEKRRQLSDIAEECSCTSATVSRWLDKYSIETRAGRTGDVRLFGEDNPNYNGGPKRYGPGWNKRKKETIRERDDHTCQDPNCSVTQSVHLNEYGQKLHVHHLRKARDVDNPEERNAKENLITLCRDCHDRWEKMADAGLVPEVEI